MHRASFVCCIRRVQRPACFGQVYEWNAGMDYCFTMRLAICWKFGRHLIKYRVIILSAEGFLIIQIGTKMFFNVFWDCVIKLNEKICIILTQHGHAE